MESNGHKIIKQSSECMNLIIFCDYNKSFSGRYELNNDDLIENKIHSFKNFFYQEFSLRTHQATLNGLIWELDNVTGHLDFPTVASRQKDKQKHFLKENRINRTNEEDEITILNNEIKKLKEIEIEESVQVRKKTDEYNLIQHLKSIFDLYHKKYKDCTS